jgi:serine/threonine-protein kinase
MPSVGGPTPPPLPPDDDGGGDGGPGNNRWWWIAALAIIAIAAVIIVFVLASNGDDDDTSPTTSSSTSTSTTVAPTTTTEASTTTRPATTTTAATPTGAPQITSFSGPDSVECNAPTEVELSWATENATRTTISIDGPGVFAEYGPNMTTLLPFACDGDSHSYTLTAIGSDNRTASQTKTITQAS